MSAFERLFTFAELPHREQANSLFHSDFPFSLDRLFACSEKMEVEHRESRSPKPHFAR